MEDKFSIEHLILVGEDDPDDTLLLRDAFFEIDQHEVIFTSDGKLLLAHIRQLQLIDKLPKLIVIDLNMPFLDGRSVIQELKRDDKTTAIPIVVLSSSKNWEDIDQVIALGANAFFTKPSSFSDLVAITRSITEKWLLPNEADEQSKSFIN